MEITIEKFNCQDDLIQQRRLFNECFSENIGTSVATLEHYNWKFKSFPSVNCEPAFEYVAKIDDEIIGYYAAIPYEYILNGHPFNVAMVCDVMTGVKARGKGVFTKLGLFATAQFKSQGLAFSTGYPIRTEVIPGHKKAGWDFPFQIPMYGKFLKMNAFLKSRNKSLLTPFVNIVFSILNAFTELSYGKSKLISVETYSSRELKQIIGLDDFLTQWKNENPIALNKSVNFLSWRLAAPSKIYQVSVLRDNATRKIVGYTIFRNVEKEGVPCVGVLDFCLLNDNKENAKLLLSNLTHWAKKEGRELILMMMMKQKAKKYKIQSNGFIKTPFLFSFIIKRNDDTLDSNFLFNESNWSLMWIDSDDL